MKRALASSSTRFFAAAVLAIGTLRAVASVTDPRVSSANGARDKVTTPLAPLVSFVEPGASRTSGTASSSRPGPPAPPVGTSIWTL